MGYTHYFSFNNKIRGRTKQVESLYQTAISDCTRIANAYSKENGGLSGFSAHRKPGQYGGFNINGSENSGSCEDFSLREHYKLNEPNFVKTNRYPYDTVVVACLIVLKQLLGDDFNVSSDGYATDWLEGLQLVTEVLGPGYEIPSTIQISRKLRSVSNE